MTVLLWGLWMFCGQPLTCTCYRDFLQTLYPSLIELVSCSPMQSKGTLLPRVFDLLFLHIWIKADSKSCDSAYPTLLPMSLPQKCRKKCKCLKFSLRGLICCTYLQVQHTAAQLIQGNSLAGGWITFLFLHAKHYFPK